MSNIFLVTGPLMFYHRQSRIHTPDRQTLMFPLKRRTTQHNLPSHIHPLQMDDHT